MMGGKKKKKGGKGERKGRIYKRQHRPEPKRKGEKKHAVLKGGDTAMGAGRMKGKQELCPSRPRGRTEREVRVKKNGFPYSRKKKKEGESQPNLSAEGGRYAITLTFKEEENQTNAYLFEKKKKSNLVCHASQ